MDWLSIVSLIVNVALGLLCGFLFAIWRDDRKKLEQLKVIAQRYIDEATEKLVEEIKEQGVEIEEARKLANQKVRDDISNTDLAGYLNRLAR